MIYGVVHSYGQPLPVGFIVFLVVICVATFFATIYFLRK